MINKCEKNEEAKTEAIEDLEKLGLSEYWLLTEKTSIRSTEYWNGISHACFILSDKDHR